MRCALFVTLQLVERPVVAWFPHTMQVQDNLRAALQVAADEAAKGEHDDPIPSPVEVAQLVEEAMFGFYGAHLCQSHGY